MGKIKFLFWMIFSLRYKVTFRRFGWLSVLVSPIFINNSKKHISIGRNVKIWHNARLEAITKYKGTHFNPNLIIEENVGIQQNFHCTCASAITIGRGTAITQNVGIFDINHNYMKIGQSILDQDINAKPVYIGENCFIGMNSVILPGTVLGKQNVVAAGSVVKGKFPDYVVIAGNPARIIKKYSMDAGRWENAD
jgi:acetyltransferase-like isoleucine patch superfamily enzyme